MTAAPPTMPDPNIRHRQPPTPVLAIVSLIAGVMVVLSAGGGCCCMGVPWLFVPIAAVVAVTCGHLALRRIDGEAPAGIGMAIAGLVLGYIGAAVCLLALVLIVVDQFVPGLVTLGPPTP